MTDEARAREWLDANWHSTTPSPKDFAAYSRTEVIRELHSLAGGMGEVCSVPLKEPQLSERIAELRAQEPTT